MVERHVNSQILRYHRKNEPRANKILQQYGSKELFLRKGRGLGGFSFSFPSFSMPSWKQMVAGATLGLAGMKAAKMGTNYAVPNIRSKMATVRDKLRNIKSSITPSFMKGNSPKPAPNQAQIDQTTKSGKQAFKTSKDSLYHDPTMLYMDNIETNAPAIDSTSGNRINVPHLKSKMYHDSQSKKPIGLDQVLQKLPRIDETKKPSFAVEHNPKKQKTTFYEANKENTPSYKGSTLKPLEGNNPTAHGSDIFFDAEGRHRKAYRLRTTFNGGITSKLKQRYIPY